MIVLSIGGKQEQNQREEESISTDYDNSVFKDRFSLLHK